MSDGAEYVRREILKTGYPLELEIYSILQSKIWIPTAQGYFFDEDENKARSIDIYAWEMPEIDKEGNIVKPPIEPFRFNFNLAIECKKSKNNWVFFPIEDYYTSIDGQSLSFLENEMGLSIISGLNADGFGHYNPSQTDIASLFTILPADRKNTIFEAIMQLLKYITYSKNRIYERIKDRKDMMHSINIWFPIIVFDGKMWNVRFEKGEIKEVVESFHTVLKRYYRSSYSIDEEMYSIDIVNREYFPKLLEIIHKDMSEIYDELLKDDRKAYRYYLKEYDIDIRDENASA